jgi:hypothetical protein
MPSTLDMAFCSKGLRAPFQVAGFNETSSRCDLISGVLRISTAADLVLINLKHEHADSRRKIAVLPAGIDGGDQRRHQ